MGVSTADGLANRVSDLNSTETPLLAGATFTGPWEEVVTHASISIIGTTDVAGTLYADFSTNGSTTSRAVQLSTGTDASLGIHSLIPVARYFRVRLVNGGSNQSSLSIQTIYCSAARIAQPTSRLGQNITPYSDVLNTRSVLANVNGTNVQVTDNSALVVTQPREGKSAFGDALVCQASPEVFGNFVYNINTDIFDVRENVSGSVSQASAMASVSSGAAANSGAYLRTKESLRYQPGFGSRARFTALFTTGVAGSTQLAGLGDESNGFFFGYNGASFGILHRYNGTPEVRTLTITTKSTTAENITITLDGVSTGDTVAVTDATSTDASTTANEIAAHDFSDVGPGWSAKAVGSTVIFTSWNAAAHTGAYSLGGATTAQGTFAQTIAGAAPSEDWTAQASWNGADIFNGSGVTGITLSPTTGNVYQIAMQWLGFGCVYFYIEDPDDGEYHLVHTLQWPNSKTAPSISNPSLPIMLYAANTSNDTAVVVKSSSVSGMSDGSASGLGYDRALLGQDASVGNSEAAFFSFRSKTIFSSKINKVKCVITSISAAASHTKPIVLRIYKNPTLTGASWSDVDTTNSVLQTDTSATFSGGKLLYVVNLANSSQYIEIPSDSNVSVVNPGDVITVTSDSATSGGAADISFIVSELL